MSTDIIFDENKYKIKSRSILGVSQVPAMTRFLIAKGVVKNEKSAYTLLLGMMTVFFLAAIYVFIFYVLEIELFNNKSNITITPEQVQTNKDRIQQFKNKNINNNSQDEI